MAESATTQLTGFACSPRAKGNSDAALSLFLQQLEVAGRPNQRIDLRAKTILPCRGCQQCTHSIDTDCFQKAKDQSKDLFAPLLTSPALCFSAPIYYYHLPSAFKAFIDRSQSYYARKRQGDPAICGLPARKAYVILVAGRPKGEKLFAGSLLTLTYFLEPFNITLAEPCLLRGLDATGDFAKSKEAKAAVEAYGKMAAEDLRL